MAHLRVARRLVCLHLELFDWLTADSQKIICSTETRSTGIAEGNAEVRLFRISVSGFWDFEIDFRFSSYRILGSGKVSLQYGCLCFSSSFSGLYNWVIVSDVFDFLVEGLELVVADFSSEPLVHLFDENFVYPNMHFPFPNINPKDFVPLKILVVQLKKRKLILQKTKFIDLVREWQLTRWAT